MKKPGRSLALEILISIQGTRSAAALSQRLGYKSNQVSRWLSGHSTMTWADLLKICENQKVPVRRRLRELALYTGHPGDLKALLSHFRPLDNQVDLARDMKAAPSTLTKWLKGSSSPPADTIFELIRKTPYSLENFVRAFVPEKRESEALTKIFAAQKSDHQTLLAQPWMPGLLSLIEIDRFASRKEDLGLRLAEELGFAPALMNDVIEKLKKQGILLWRTDTGRYEVRTGRKFLDVSGEKAHMSRMLRFWNQFALHEALRDPLPENNMGRGAFVTVPMSKAGLEEAHRALVEFAQKINSLTKTEDYDHVFCFTILMADLLSPSLGTTKI